MGAYIVISQNSVGETFKQAPTVVVLNRSSCLLLLLSLYDAMPVL